MNPTLTTVRARITELGGLALERLASRSKAGLISAQHQTLRADLTCVSRPRRRHHRSPIAPTSARGVTPVRCRHARVVLHLTELLTTKADHDKTQIPRLAAPRCSRSPARVGAMSTATVRGAVTAERKPSPRHHHRDQHRERPDAHHQPRRRQRGSWAWRRAATRSRSPRPTSRRRRGPDRAGRPDRRP
jgi:hypothetical protein